MKYNNIFILCLFLFHNMQLLNYHNISVSNELGYNGPIFDDIVAINRMN